MLKIDGKQVSRVGEVEVGALPEGAVFSPDGKYLYVGNYIDRNVSPPTGGRRCRSRFSTRGRASGEPGVRDLVISLRSVVREWRNWQTRWT